MLRMGACVVFCLVAGNAVQADTLYRWTDKNGVVHFSDRPAPSSELVKRQPALVKITTSYTPVNNDAEDRWHGALRAHGVQIRTIVIKQPAPTHSRATGP